MAAISSRFKSMALAALLVQGGAHAALVSNEAAIPEPLHVITFDAFDGLTTTGPVNVGAEVGDNVIFTSTPFAELGAHDRVLGTNGTWGAGARFVASDFITASGELGFSFASGVISVGAFFNQFQTLAGGNHITLLAYDMEGNTLESHSFSIDTAASGTNEGQFLGIQRTTADIYGFGIADGTFVLDNLRYSAASPVPEPGALVLMVAGLGLAGLARRRLP